MPGEKAEKQQKSIIYPKVNLGDVLGAIWQGVRPKKWLLFVLIGSLIMANLASVVTPLFYKQFFDAVSTNLTPLAIAPHLLTLILSIAFFNLLGWIFYRIADFTNNTFEPYVMANLRQQSYDYMMLHSYSFFVGNFSGSLVQRVNRFARAFERLTDDLVGNLLPLLVRIVAILFVVFFINAWLGLVMFAWITVFMAFNIGFSSWKVKYDVQVAETDSKATGYLADTITNQNTIQLFGGYKHESQGYKKVTTEQARISRFSWNLNGILYSVQSFLGVLIEFVLFYYAIKYWEQGLITVGVFVLLQAYVLNILDQFWGFTRVVRDVYQSYADAKEMVEIKKLSHEITDKPGAKELKVASGTVEFKDLTFAFNETRKVLENVNFKIAGGEKVALVGPSGAGKTTFVRLLLRLYSPTAGKILIDGNDISDVTQESLRKNISMVPQDPILFHRTLAENIAYGKRDAAREEIEKAAAMAHCDEFIKDLPLGLETYVGERGVKLSGGERQRVAIARAILKNAPILILDEATSSLDSASEMLIQDALNNLMRGKTTIVIAHRLSTIQKMDRIIVIDQGKIIEQGSHGELLDNENSLYRKLWTLQAGGFLKDDEEESEEDEDESFDKIQDESADSDGEDESAQAKSVNF